jgi:hypothetical protein
VESAWRTACSADRRSALTINTFLRRDQVYYDPSRDPFADTPVTVGEYRSLANYGMRADFNYVHRIHNLKIGTQLMQTRLNERFSLGVTQPGFTDGQPGLIPYDLSAGGSPFHFTGRTNVNEYAFYIQDTITLGHLTFTPGLRIDRYDGLSKATAAEPRLGHGVPRRLFAQPGNPVQREPDPLQLHRHRRTGHQCLRRLCGSPHPTRTPQPVQPGTGAIAEQVSPNGRRLLLEIHR